MYTISILLQTTAVIRARVLYERLVTQFPTSGRYWRLFIEQEVNHAWILHASYPTDLLVDLVAIRSMCTHYRGLHGSRRLHAVFLSGIANASTCNLIKHSVKVTVEPIFAWTLHVCMRVR